MTKELAMAKFSGDEKSMLEFVRGWLKVTASVRENAKKKGVNLADVKIGVRRDE